MKKIIILYLSRFLIIIISILTLLSYIKGIWISLDIDESYAVAMGYRLVKGDRLVADMWESHQFSAFASALFTAPYVWIRGNTDYLVIYLRIVSVLIHLGLGFLLYRQLRKNCDKVIVLGIMFLHLIFLPKWVQSLEFELMHYWCLLGIFLLLHAYFTGEKKMAFLPFGGGICLVGSMMCYPTMILLYPFYLLGIYVLERQCHGERGWKTWRGGLFFTAGALSAGISFLGCLFHYMSWEELLRYLSYIFMDTSHNTYTIYEKWSMYLSQIQEQISIYTVYLLVAVGIIAFLYLVYVIILRVNRKNRRKIVFHKKHIEILLLMTLLLTGLLIQGAAIFGFVFDDRNQFFLQMRYMALLLPALILGIRYHRRIALWLYLCVLPGLLSVPAVLFVTNMDTNVTYAKAFLGVLGSFLIFYQYGKEILEEAFWKKSFLVLQHVAGGLVLVGLLVCRLLLIRVTGCLPVSILAPLEELESGPGAGIYILKDAAEIWNDNYRELARCVKEGDKLLYIGAENLTYVKEGILIATPSTQGTVVYNEMFLYYYAEHPERLPNVVVYDKTFAEDPNYSLSFSASLQSRVFFDWLEENYADSQRIETDYMIILRKESLE